MRARQNGPHPLRVRFEAVDGTAFSQNSADWEVLPFELEWQLDHDRLQRGGNSCSFLTANSDGLLELLLHELHLAKGEWVRLSVRVGRIPIEYQGRVWLGFGPRERRIDPDLVDLLVILLALRLVRRSARRYRSTKRRATSAHPDVEGIGTVVR